MRTYPSHRPWFHLFLVAAALVLLGGNAARALVITIDLTQVDTESTGDIAGDTWRWGGTNPVGFDLEFSNGEGNGHLDLDGGSRGGSSYYTGSESTSNHTYDIIQATYLQRNDWKIEAIRGTTTYWIGTVNEFSGTLSHSANYSYTSSESHPVNGPADTGANTSSPSL